MGKKTTKRSYTDEDVAHAITVVQANGGNVLKSSRELAIPYPTLRTWMRGQRRQSTVAGALSNVDDLARQERSLMARDYHALMREAFVKVRELIPDAKNVRDMTILLGTATDKWIALTGGAKSTQEVNVTLTLAELYTKHLPAKIVDVPSKELPARTV